MEQKTEKGPEGILDARQELAKFRAAHQAKHISVASTQWDYLIGGRGQEPILLFPGLIGIAEMSFPLILRLESEYRVVAPSYPSKAATIHQLLEGAAAILDAEDIPWVNVLGGSYGGFVAQRFVRRYPNRVRKLILSGTLGPNPERPRQDRKLISIMRLLPTGIIRVLLRRLTRQALESVSTQRDFWEAYFEEMIGSLTKADLINRYKVKVDFDETSKFGRDDLKQWPGRILILEGDNDPIVSAPARQALAALYPQAQTRVFHGPGHAASIAKVDEYSSMIKDFLKE